VACVYQWWVLGERHCISAVAFMVAEDIPYLAKEGYPYHLFEEAHLEPAKEGEEIKADQARNQWLVAFLKSRGECSLRKMGSIFKVFLTKAEIESSVQELVSARKLKIQKGKATTNASVMC